ncbi:MAG: polysaccharide biosynthesis C-terminal domain-containing protein [Ignavibacteriales bacterium]
MSRENDGKKTIKASIVNIISVGISMIVSLVSLSILSNLLTPSDMGISTSFITLQTVISYIITLSIYTSINKVMLNKKIELDNYFSTITIFTIISIIGYYILYYIFKGSFNSLFGFNTLLMTFLFLSILFDNIVLYFFTKWTFKNEYIKVFIYNFITSPLSQILSIFLVLFCHTDKYWGKIIGLKALPIVIGILFLIYILIKGKFSFDKKYLKYGLQISTPFVAHLLSQVLLSNSDLLMIKSMVGAESAGIYSVAYTISNIVYSLIICILKPWSPWVYRRLDNDEIEPIYKNSSNIIILFFIITLGLITVAPEMIKTFLNSTYFSAVNIIVPISLGMYFQGLYVIFYDVEYYYEQGKIIAYYSILTAIINIILNYIFIKNYGYTAAAYTTLISYILLTVFNYYGMKKIGKKKIFDSKIILFYSLALFFLCFANLYFINNFIIRYLIFIIAIIIIYILNRRNILFIFNQVLNGKSK